MCWPERMASAWRMESIMAMGRSHRIPLGIFELASFPSSSSDPVTPDAPSVSTSMSISIFVPIGKFNSDFNGCNNKSTSSISNTPCVRHIFNTFLIWSAAAPKSSSSAPPSTSAMSSNSAARTALPLLPPSTPLPSVKSVTKKEARRNVASFKGKDVPFSEYLGISVRWVCRQSISVCCGSNLSIVIWGSFNDASVNLSVLPSTTAFNAAQLATK